MFPRVTSDTPHFRALEQQQTMMDSLIQNAHSLILPQYNPTSSIEKADKSTHHFTKLDIEYLENRAEC